MTYLKIWIFISYSQYDYFNKINIQISLFAQGDAALLEKNYSNVGYDKMMTC